LKDYKIDLEEKMRKTITKVLSVMGLSLAVFALGACSAPEAAEEVTPEVAVEEAAEVNEDLPTFKIGAIPDQNASKLNKRFDELAAHIASETGLEVEYVPSADYAALVTGFERGDIQLGWFGGLTGVQARNVAPGAEAIAQRPRDEEFHSVFVAQKGLGLKSLEDLKGHTFTFGSESSTSGHLMPRFYMMEAGLKVTEELNGQPNFSGSHDKTWKLVETGAFEAGALNEAVWESALENGKVDLEKIEVFYVTPSYYDYNWTVNAVDSVYGEGTKDKVQAALLSFGESKPEIMELFSADKFIATENANYEAIEAVAKELGIIQ
jgi:phosphonate transport system substrate-binding protein